MANKKHRSYVDNNGNAYYRRTGRYNEVTREATGMFPGGGSNELNQHNLAPKGPNSAAAITTRKAFLELQEQENKKKNK